MKKILLLPAFLAVCGFAIAPSKAISGAKAVETLTITAQQIIQDSDQGESVSNVRNDLVEYGIRAGDPTASYMVNFVDFGDENDGDVKSSDGNVLMDWGADKVDTKGGQYLLLGFMAMKPFNLTVSGSVGGWVENTKIRYFLADDTYDFASRLDPIAEVLPEGNSFSNEKLSYSIDVPLGYTFCWAWGGHSDQRNMQNLKGLTFTLTYDSTIVAPGEIEREPETASYNIEDMYCRPSWTGSDMTGTLANYGFRFGTLNQATPYSTSFTYTGNGAYVVNGSTIEWWNIPITAENGFAFAVTANKRITVTAAFDDLPDGGSNPTTSYAWIAQTTISYDIVRNGNVIKNVYSYNNTTDNVEVNIPTMTCNELIELLPGDTLYIGFNLNEGVEGSRNIQLKNYNNFKVNLTEVIMSSAASKLIDDWFELRARNSGDLCNLDTEDTATLNTLIEIYEALDEENKEIVGRTYDVGEYTIADFIAYFKAHTSSMSYLITNSDNNTTYLFVIVLALSTVAVAAISIKKRRTSTK